MRIEIVRAGDATAGTRDTLRALTAAVYPPEDADASPVRDVVWSPAQWHALIRDAGGDLMSHVGFLVRDGRLDATAARIGGIGGVKTHPVHRGQGYAAAGVRHAAAFFAEQGDVAFALLVCDTRVMPFYARDGWLPFAGTLLVEQPSGIIPFTVNETTVRPVRDAAPETGTIDLCGLPW